MPIISQVSGYLFLGLFGLVMLLVTLFITKWRGGSSRENFLLADRQVGWIQGSSSIAASWIWAPALFVSVQLAYEKGLAGIFWFTFPNIIALGIFAFLAPRIRNRMPDGYTLPQYIRLRLGSEAVHKIYLIPYVFYQVMAITVQIFAGGSLISLLTSIPLLVVMPILAIIALAYTLVSGLRASVITDFIQLLAIFGIGTVVIYMSWNTVGGFSAVQAGFNGIEGVSGIFDSKVAFSLGIVSAIGLISGALSDQQYWQRSFAIKKNQLVRSFVVGAILFAIVPIALSVLGFIAANSSVQIHLPAGVDASMIGVQTVVQLLPGWASFLFIIMLLAGLSSTLDSGLSAVSSLWITDMKKIKKEAEIVKSARLAMISFAGIGLLISYAVVFIPQFGLFHLWWIFNTIAACVAVPTVLSLYWDSLSAKGVFWGVLISFIFGLPLFIYGNYINNPGWTVGASLFIVLVSTLFCVVFRRKKEVAVSVGVHA